MKSNKLHIGALVHDYIVKNGYSKNFVAQSIGKSVEVLKFMLKQESLKCYDLYKLSLALNYNFFKVIGESLPSDYLPLTLQEKELFSNIEILKEEIKILQQEKERLEKEKSFLEHTITLITKNS